VAHSYVGVMQQTKVPKPRDVRRLMKSATKGTQHEGLSQRQCYATFKKRKALELHTGKVHTQEERRWRWMTYDNINDWFDMWKSMLLEYHFCVDVPDATTGSEVTFNNGAMGRIINADEKHRIFSNEGDKGGSRASGLTDPRFPTGGRRIVKNSTHTTEMHGTTSNHEVIPSMFIFDTSCEDETNQKISAAWLLGVPGVRGKFGHSEVHSYSPAFAVTSNGSMELQLFEQWLEKCIYPLYPDMSPTFVYDDDGSFVSGPVVLKIDMGPGRLSKSAENARMRRQAAKRGLIIFLGCRIPPQQLRKWMTCTLCSSACAPL